MPKFGFFFGYTPETWSKMIASPNDRVAAVRASAQAVGGELECLYFMFGQTDGFAVVDLPDADAAAAMALAVNSSGAFRSLETHELIEPEHLPGVLARAGQLVGRYQPPGN